MADNLVLGILIGIASGISALIVIAAVTLRRFDAARHSENVRLQRTLADLQRTVRQELGAMRRDFDAVASAQERQVEVLADRVTKLTDGAITSVRQDVAAAASRQSEQGEALARRLTELNDNAVITLRHDLTAAAGRQSEQGDALAHRLTELNDNAVTTLRHDLAAAAGRQSEQGDALAHRLSELGDNVVVALRHETADAARRQSEQGEDLAHRLSELTDQAVAALRDHPLPVLTRLAEVQEQRLSELAGEFSRLSEVMAADAAGHAKDLRNELLESLKLTLDEFRAAHAAQLEQVRTAVDEKLESTLERRLGDSFRVVSERLEVVSDRLDHVHRGLGEVQTFAAGLGHLQRAVATVRLGGSKNGPDKGADPAGRIRGPRRKPVATPEDPVEASPTSAS